MTDTITIDLLNPKSQMHWGKYIESTVPVTGVGNNNDVGSYSREYHTDWIDPELEQWIEDNPGLDPADDYSDEPPSQLLEGFIKTEDGKYDIDPTGTYAIIWSDWAGSTWQFLKSPYVQFCEPCSPCCPGQVSLGTHGEYLGFSPSLEGFEEGYDTEIPKVWVWDLEYEIKRVEAITNRPIKTKTIGVKTYPDENPMTVVRQMDKLIPYLGALSSAHSANQLNPNQRILVKQRRID